MASYAFSSSSSSLLCFTPQPAAASTVKAQGNAHFVLSMQQHPSVAEKRSAHTSTAPITSQKINTQNASLPAANVPHKGIADGSAGCATAARKATGPTQPSSRLRRVYSSSSSSSSSSSASSTATCFDAASGASSHLTKLFHEGCARPLLQASEPSRGPDFYGTTPRKKNVTETVLSADAFRQVQQELHHPRVKTRHVRDAIARGAAPPSSALPGWWSCESSVLPGGSTLPSSSSASSASTAMEAVMHREAPHGPSRINQTSHAHRQRKRYTAAAAAAAAHTHSPSSSSCGCPTGCACRTEDGSLDASLNSSLTGATPVDTSRSSDDRSIALSCGASYCSSCRPQRTSPSASSQRGSSQASSSLCSSCEAAARTRVLRCGPKENAVRDSGASGSPHRPTRRGPTASAAHVATQDVFLDAVRGDTMWAEVPPLLYLSRPYSSSGGEGKASSRKDDAAVQAERERADLRAHYIAQAALLAAGRGGEKASQKAGVDGSTGERRETLPENIDQRYSAATQTTLDDGDVRTQEKKEAAAAAEERRCRDAQLAEERLKSFAAAQCAEVALPMLQRELASYETRASAQSQQQMEGLVQQLRDYQSEIQKLQEGRAAELREHRQQWEQEQHHAQELLELRRRARRKDAWTLVDDEAIRVFTSISSPPPAAAASADAVRYTAGTQHSDGTLERLATLQSAATAWLMEQLYSLEAHTRHEVEADEAERRQFLHDVLEEPSRRMLLQCQNEVLHWRQQCLVEQQSAAYSSDLRVLLLQEKLARQELEERCDDCFCDLQLRASQQRFQATVTAARVDAQQVQQVLCATQEELAALRTEHQDALDHMRQLRVQLLHALRLPTITLADDSGAAAPRRQAPGAPLLDAAYAYATATGDAENGNDRGDTAEIAAGAASFLEGANAVASRRVASVILAEVDDLPVHRRFARAHQEALRVVRAQCRTV